MSSSAAREQAWNEDRLVRPVARAAWRTWTYDRPAIVLGCSQRRLFDAAGPGAGVEILVRRSGGGAVLVGPWMVGVSVALPPDHSMVSAGPVASYRWLGECLARVLRTLGVPARALPPEEARQHRAALDAAPGARSGPDWACFAGIVPWEAVARARKLTGLAQVRRRDGVLLVGGLLLEPPDWPLLCAALGKPAEDAAALAQLTTSCAREGAADLAPWRVADAVGDAIAEALHAAPAG